MDILADILNLAGSLICHQLPSRTIYAEGMPLPVCARDTGIYLGVFTGAVFAVLFRRMRCDRPPSLPYAIFLCLMLMPMMFDGIGSYLGLFPTNNTVRLVTGVLFGMSLTVLLIPAANFKIYASNRNKALRNPMELFVYISAGLLLCVPVLAGVLPWVLISTVVIAAMVFLIGRIVYTLISLMRQGNKKRLMLKTVAATVCVLFAMYMVSSLILQPLKAVLLK